MSQLKDFYLKTVFLDLKKSLNINNDFMVPAIKKISVNMGLGEKGKNKIYMQSIKKDLYHITGQKPCITFAKKGIASFRIREGWPIGLKVTLRKDKMYFFLERLINVVIPRIRDFRGFSLKSFDKNSNYSFGINNHSVFPEVDLANLDYLVGMDITFNFNTKNNEYIQSLLRSIKFPLVALKK